MIEREEGNVVFLDVESMRIETAFWRLGVKLVEAELDEDEADRILDAVIAYSCFAIEELQEEIDFIESVDPKSLQGLVGLELMNALVFTRAMGRDPLVGMRIQE